MSLIHKKEHRRAYTIVVGLLFLAVAVLHLARLIHKWDVHIGKLAIPLWVSWVIMIIMAGLSYWSFRRKVS